MPKAQRNADELSEDLVQGSTGAARCREVVWKIHLFVEARSVRAARERVLAILTESRLGRGYAKNASALKYWFDDVPCDTASRCIPVDMTAVCGHSSDSGNSTDDELKSMLRRLKSVFSRIPEVMSGQVEAVGTFDVWHKIELWPAVRISTSLKRRR